MLTARRFSIFVPNDEDDAIVEDLRARHVVVVLRVHETVVSSHAKRVRVPVTYKRGAPEAPEVFNFGSLPPSFLNLWQVLTDFNFFPLVCYQTSITRTCRRRINARHSILTIRIQWLYNKCLIHSLVFCARLIFFEGMILNVSLILCLHALSMSDAIVQYRGIMSNRFLDTTRNNGHYTAV